VIEQLAQAGSVTELVGGLPPDKEMTPTIVGTRDVKDPGDGDADGEESR
jgi:hypothetical protein